MRLQRNYNLVLTALLATSICLGAEKSEDDSSSDQQRKRNDAATAAAVTAGVQSIACLMLMKKAQETGDTLMMVMAMQQCSQAAQSAQNANQNKEGAKKLASPDPIKPPEAKNEPFKVPEDRKTESPQFSQPAASSAPFQLPEPTQAAKGEAVKPVIPDSKDATTKTAAGPSGPASTVPNSIDAGKLGYDATGKSSLNPSQSNGNGLGLGTPGTQTSSTAAGDPSVSSFYAKNMKQRGRGARDDETDAGFTPLVAAAAEGKSGGDGGAGIEAMMALLRGGGAAGQASMGTEILVPPSVTNSTDKPGTIFDVATFRYSRLADNAQIQRRSMTRELASTVR